MTTSSHRLALAAALAAATGSTPTAKSDATASADKSAPASLTGSLTGLEAVSVEEARAFLQLMFAATLSEQELTFRTSSEARTTRRRFYKLRQLLSARVAKTNPIESIRFDNLIFKLSGCRILIRSRTQWTQGVPNATQDKP